MSELLSTQQRPTQIGEVLYCFLEGEMDKETFEEQCEKCHLATRCTVERDHKYNVADDWHSMNMQAFMPEESKTRIEKKRVTRRPSYVRKVIITPD